MSPTANIEVGKVLTSGFIGQGKKVEEFETKLKKIFNNDYLLTVNSCTSALTLALHLIKETNSSRNEIIVSPLTCFATIAAIISNGFNICWADVNPDTCNIDTLDVERKVNKNTCGIVLVHWGGSPVDINHINKIKTKYETTYGQNLPVIEDCAHCWESRYEEELIGNSRNYCCFSFQAIKFLTMGDGGLLILPNAEIYHRAKLLRWFGLDRESGSSFRCMQNIKESGFKYHCTDIDATIGLENLPFVSKNVSVHKSNANFYNENLKNLKNVNLLKNQVNSESSYWIYTIKVEDRTNFIKYLKNKGIEAGQIHNRCDKHSAVEQFKSLLPGMDELESQYVAIPCGWWVTEEQRSYIVDCIKEGW